MPRGFGTDEKEVKKDVARQNELARRKELKDRQKRVEAKAGPQLVVPE